MMEEIRNARFTLERRALVVATALGLLALISLFSSPAKADDGYYGDGSDGFCYNGWVAVNIPTDVGTVTAYCP